MDETTIREAEPETARDEEPLASEAAMIDAMRRYRAARADQERRKERAAEYLRQVKAEIEQDLGAGEDRLERMRASMLVFVTEHNGGRKFAVPGLGTVTTTTRARIEITDEERFLAALPETRREALFDRRLNASRAKATARSALEDEGEQLPGVEAELVTSLSVRLIAQ